MTPYRRLAIVSLLEGRDEHLPGVRVRSLSASGFAHRVVVRESCEDCLANGRVLVGCETCRGRGWVEFRRLWDPMEEERTRGWFASSAQRHERVRARDREIGVLGEQVAAARPEAEVAVGEEGWVLERERRWARFDFAHLDRALERLRVVDADAYRELHGAVVYGWKPGAAAVVERGLVFLDRVLPDPVLAPGVEVERLAVEQRDVLVRRLVGEGRRAREVGDLVGLSVSQVHRVVRR